MISFIKLQKLNVLKKRKNSFHHFLKLYENYGIKVQIFRNDKILWILLNETQDQYLEDKSTKIFHSALTIK